MSWVRYEDDDRWQRHELEARARQVLASEYPDAVELRQQAANFAVGVGLMDSGKRDRLDAMQQRRAELAALVEVEMGRMALLSSAMDVEAAQRLLASGSTDAAARAQAQTTITGASSLVMDLVTLRNRNAVGAV